ncbi:hypothetical protein ER13_00915 [Brevundimonas sp. EAKA]|uniref:PIN domain-containing protein n=1 Tax=unclassified Brevundimonas TaxID=2622653 RepID=UPI0004A941E8|nr:MULTISPECIES: PIN domain-containing protein [unclassified Brevundimonas]KDP93507.1 hypothetical protein ER13_00915 [Brevundimonas sp. EAKA]MBU4196003.1 DUF4935 domain-containing protein [Alphaproteobacteria bacterium]MCG2664697.1 PIN domain-containing protein [Brevundimonas sp.]
MPKLTEAELHEAIVQGRFGAITVDTNIFDKFGCNLDMRALRALGPVAAQHEIKLIFSDIIAGEVQTHIRRVAAEQADKLRTALNQYRKAWRRIEAVTDLAVPVDLNADPAILAADEWEDYLGAVGGEVVTSEGRANMGELVRRYFAEETPFMTTAAKKAEFPDAIALLALDAWAQEEGCLILAISKDGDWQAYAETSTNIVCVPEFEGTLNRFNAAGLDLVKKLTERLRAGEADEVKDEIDLELESWLSEADFEVEARSDFSFDAQTEGAFVQEWEIVGEPQVLALEGEEVTFALELDCLIAFSAYFTLSTWDSVDGEYVSLNGQTEETEANHRVTVTLRVDRRGDPDPDVLEVEANRRRLTADFGLISLDWGYEE